VITCAAQVRTPHKPRISPPAQSPQLGRRTRKDLWADSESEEDALEQNFPVRGASIVTCGAPMADGRSNAQARHLLENDEIHSTHHVQVRRFHACTKGVRSNRSASAQARVVTEAPSHVPPQKLGECSMSSAVVSTVTVDIFERANDDAVASRPARPVLSVRELEIESKGTKYEVRD